MTDSGCFPPPALISKEDLIEFLKENLRIEVKSQSNYTGGLDGSGNLYANSHVIQLTLNGELISEASLD